MVRYKIVKKKGIRFPDNKKITYYELKKFIPKEKIWFCFGYAKTLKDANKQIDDLNETTQKERTKSESKTSTSRD